MKKRLNVGFVALMSTVSIAMSAAPAAAHDDWDHHHDDTGALIAGGIVGLAVGAALTSHHNGYGSGYVDYGPGYHEPGYSVYYHRHYGHNGYGYYYHHHRDHDAPYGYGGGYYGQGHHHGEDDDDD